MLAPKWLQIVTGLALFNSALVAVSLIHRHLIAVEPNHYVSNPAREAGDIRDLVDSTVTTPEPPKSPSLLEKLDSDAPSVLQSKPLPVADDDPLMAEIRKQMSEKFSDLSLQPISIGGTTDDVKATPSGDNRTAQQKSRMSTISQLSTAANSLLMLSDELRLSGKTAEADKALQQAEQLQATIREMVQ